MTRSKNFSILGSPRKDESYISSNLTRKRAPSSPSSINLTVPDALEVQFSSI